MNRTTLLLPVRLVRCTLALAFLLGAAPVIAQSVTYPVLVYSSSAGQHDVPVTINVAQASQATRLCVTTHQAAYNGASDYVWASWPRRDDAAGISLNGGTFVTNWNTTGLVEYPADRYEGVGGAFHTVRVCFPVNGGTLGSVSEGANTVAFRFYGVQDDARSGYRVIDIDVENASGIDLIQGELQDDPETWTIANQVGAAYDNPTSISNGAALWTARNSLAEVGSGASITAACSDCHATSGYDLKYFNYEALVIETRARHHGLSATEAKEIAAYILSLDLNRTDGRETAPKGRPWNPPYQPGPGLSREAGGLAEDWSAGAGVQWVLAHDHETFDYLFSTDGVTPNPNPTQAEREAAFAIGTYNGTSASDFGTAVSLHDIPVAIQYPDWNNWLPDVHPLDGYSGYAGSQLQTDLETTVAAAFDTQAEVDAAATEYGTWLAQGMGNPKPDLQDVFEKIDYEHADWPLNGTLVPNYNTEPWRHALAMTSLAQTEAVKAFEVLAKGKMFDLADAIALGRTYNGGVGGSPSPAGEPVRVSGSLAGHDPAFAWWNTMSAVFDMAPHKTDSPGFPSEGAYGPPGTHCMQNYFSTAWYDVQAQLTVEGNGYMSPNGGDPLDWSYMQSLLNNTQDTCGGGVSQWARSVRQQAFAWQSRNNNHTRTGMGTLDHGGEWARWSATNVYKILGRDPTLPGNWRGRFHDDQTEAKQILWAAYRGWIDYVSTVPVSEWPRDGQSDRTFEAASFTPTLYPGGGYRFDDGQEGLNVYRLCEWMTAQGAPASLVSDIATYFEQLFPNGNWEQWISTDPDPQPPSVGMTSPVPGSTYEAPATVGLAADAQAPGAAVEWVRFLVDGAIVATDASAPYTHTLSDLAAGTYSLSARVRNTLGVTADSAPVTITVTPGAPEPPTVGLTQPAPGASYDAPATIAMVADASAPGDAVEWVRFLVDGTVVATDTSAPYAHTLQDVSAGSYVLTARVQNTSGATADSAPVTVTVNAPEPPTVALTSPESGTTYEAPADIVLTADAQAPSAPIEWVRFFVNGDEVSTDTSAPYGHSLDGVAAGDYTLTARVRDELGQTADSAPITITVTPDDPDIDPPVVTLTSPSSGATFEAPATVAMTADASAPSAPVESVRFLVDGAVVATDASAPYTHTLSDLAAGTYSLSARVRDELGQTVDSAPVSITVTVPPPSAQQPIALAAGWNMVSSFVLPSDSSIAVVLAEALDEIFIVQDGAGRVFLPQDGVNTLEYWRRGEAYQIYANAPTSFTVAGDPLVPEETPIVIGEGAESPVWGQIAYIRTTPMPIEVALTSISDHLLLVKDNFGLVYVPEVGLNQIGDLVPGQGYKIYVSEEARLLYPPNSEPRAARIP